MSLKNLFTDIANAIRDKKGTTSPIKASDFATEISSIEGGGSNTPAGGTETYNVKVIDYNGDILKEDNLLSGQQFSLPEIPTHSGLQFNNWICQTNIENNKIIVPEHDVTIGATYTTQSGLNEFIVEVNEEKGFSITLNIDGEKNWGDGTIDTEITHDYTNSGQGTYLITCGGDIVAGPSVGLFGQSSSSLDYKFKEVRFSYNANISNCVLSYCKNLESIVFPIDSSITKPPMYFCMSCFSLRAVILPENITEIGNQSFKECSGLSYLIIPKTLTYIENYAFQSSYLTGTIDLSSVTRVGSYSFMKNFSLNCVIFGENLSQIEPQAFNSCYSLQTVYFPDVSIKLGTSCFAECYSLNKVKLPLSTTGSPQAKAFQKCYGMELDEIGIDIGTYYFSHCYNLKNITLKNTITQISTYGFYQCYSLEKVDFNCNVTNVPNSFFSNCYSLKEIDFSKALSLNTISSEAFTNCFKLRYIKMPPNIQTIDSKVFLSCINLEEVDFSDSSVVPTLANKDAFTSTNKILKIYVPDALYDNWIVATNWASISNKIHKVSEKVV